MEIANKNILFKTTVYSKKNIHIGDVYTINGQNCHIPLHLNSLPFVEQNAVIGREEEVKRILQLLNKSDKLVLMNGLGGIGKTTLAKYFLSKYKHKFNYIAWIDQTSGIKEAFLENWQLIDSLHLQQELLAIPKHANWLHQSFDLILNRLRQLNPEKKGTNLLIIDNIQESKLNPVILDQIAMRPHWKILLTSRNKIPACEAYEIDTLNEENARTLFYKHYILEQQDIFVNELLELIGYHTLLIELIAKLGQSLQLNLQELLAKLKMTGVNLPQKSTLKFPHNSNQKITDIFVYLLKMFDISKLNNYQYWLMKQFSVLPPIYIAYEGNKNENILELLLLKAEDQKDQFTNAINALVNQGWLQWDTSKDQFKMHQLIQEVLRHKLLPQSSDCQNMIESCINLLHVTSMDNPFKVMRFLKYGDHLFRFLTDEDKGIAQLGNSLAVRHSDSGNFNIARSILERVISIREKLLSHNDPYLANSYRMMASLIDRFEGDFNQAILLNLKAIKILEQTTTQESYQLLADAYNGLAIRYRNQNNLDKAIHFSLKAIAIDIDKLQKKNTLT